MCHIVLIGCISCYTNAWDERDAGLIPGSGRSPGVGNGNPLQYACLDNSMGKEPGGLQSIGLKRAEHDWATEHACSHIPTNR